MWRAAEADGSPKRQHTRGWKHKKPLAVKSIFEFHGGGWISWLVAVAKGSSFISWRGKERCRIVHQPCAPYPSFFASRADVEFCSRNQSLRSPRSVCQTSIVFLSISSASCQPSVASSSFHDWVVIGGAKLNFLRNLFRHHRQSGSTGSPHDSARRCLVSASATEHPRRPYRTRRALLIVAAAIFLIFGRQQGLPTGSQPSSLPSRG